MPSVLPRERRAAVVFILITVALDVLSLGIIIPVLPRLVEGLDENDACLSTCRVNT